MKRLIFILFTLFAINSYSCDNVNLIGTWVYSDEDPKVEITFTCDSLYFDELDNEGMCYTYHVKGDSIMYQDCIEETYGIINIIHIVYLDEKCLGIVFDNDEDLVVYMYGKKEEN